MRVIAFASGRINEAASSARERRSDSELRLFADILILAGAILLTFGTDLIIETAGQDLASLGGLLGMLASIVGVALLVTGILNHCRLTRENMMRAQENSALSPRR